MAQSYRSKLREAFDRLKVSHKTWPSDFDEALKLQHIAKTLRIDVYKLEHNLGQYSGNNEPDQKQRASGD